VIEEAATERPEVVAVLRLDFALRPAKAGGHSSDLPPRANLQGFG
jgi:hypothetical protein